MLAGLDTRVLASPSTPTRLANGIDLVLRTARLGGGVDCEGFGGLSLLNPVLIEIEHDGSPAAAGHTEQLRREIRAELLRLSPGAAQVPVPCAHPTATPVRCHGHSTATCEKVLLLVGAGQQPFGSRPLIEPYLAAAATYHAMPIFSEASIPSPRMAVLPSEMEHLNFAIWKNSLREVVPDVLALAGITSADRRIFISYRRKDAQPLADQLFDALNRARFDVFVDRFALEPGVDFVQRLTEELAHKSMVLLLESRNMLASKWTRYEVNYARRHRLGLLALQLPGAPILTQIDADERISLKGLVSGANALSRMFGRGPRLRPDALDRVVGRIREVHEAALLRRRRQLGDEMRGALLKVGVTNQQMGPDGVLIVQGKAGRRHVRTTARPPDVTDFHIACRRVNATAKERAVVVGPADSLAAPTALSLNWLSGVSNTPYFDEGRLLDVARAIAGGQL